MMREVDPMLDVFIFESAQLLESLEETLLQSEKMKELTPEHIDEIFRIMHTIKGSSSMMSYDGLAQLSHALEDMFDKIREGKTRTDAQTLEGVIELVLASSDNFKVEIEKLSNGKEADGDFSELSDKIHKYLETIMDPAFAPAPTPALAPAPVSENSDTEEDDLMADTDSPAGTSSFDNYSADISDQNGYGTSLYKIKIKFEDGCLMENLRAFGVVTALNEHCQELIHEPADLEVEEASAEISKNGFLMFAKSNENPDSLKQIVDEIMFLESSTFVALQPDSEELPPSMRQQPVQKEEKSISILTTLDNKPMPELNVKQNFISVNVNKLDKLMNLMGEIVTTESMVTKNPEIVNLHIDSFERSSQELRKLINELQDIVVSIRMLPVSNTFQKMHRIVRDISKSLGKEVELDLVGEDTEVDKNIIDTLSDPLMHLIRNAVDHGIETPDNRLKSGKPATGTIKLEARSTGSDVLILISDDGAGLDKNAILAKAYEKGLLVKPESEMSDKEAYNLIFHPGFSTNTDVTAYSGRGVGMDVVKRNIDKVGGTIYLDSTPGVGTSIQIRIPLTLAIVDGMKLRVGNLLFIVPTLSIQESFKPNDGDVFLDPDGAEMIMVRGEVYSVHRLYRIFNIATDYENLYDGILIMVNSDSSTYCLFVDELIGEQQAVIKPLPEYIQKHNTGMHGIGGCAVLGDGSISLIIDINTLVRD